MQPMNLNGMQVIVLSQPGVQTEQLTARSMKPRLAKQLIGLGVVHILNGVFCIIFQSIILEKAVKSPDISEHAMVGPGFWTGIPNSKSGGNRIFIVLQFLVNGIIGVSAGIRKGNCQIVSFNILSIISGILASILIWSSVMSAIAVNDYRSRSSASYNAVDTTLVLVLASKLAAVGILEGIVAIWSSIVCCLIGVCNCGLLFPAQAQPLILSAEQQAALMSNQQQTVPFNKPQENAPLYGHENVLSADNVEGAYTGLITGMNRYLTSPDMDSSACTTTSLYEELHHYDEIHYEHASHGDN